MKDYKKSFIFSALTLIGIVLLIINTIIFMYSYHASVEELKTTMMQKIEPYDTIRSILRAAPPSDNAAPSANDDSDSEPKPPEHSGNFDKKAPGSGMFGDTDMRKYAKSVYVFFYNPNEEKVSVISKNELTDNNSLLETAKKIYAAPEDFGILASESLYYYKQPTPNATKIAVASINFILFEMLELFAVLLLIFVISMLVFYFVCRQLAKRAAKPLEEAIAREKQFITDASHDLKTPLTVILSNADILSRSRDCKISEMSKWIESTKQAATNMNRLIEQMLTLSESETKTEVKSEDVNFSDIAEQNVLVMESPAYEKNISYSADIQPDIHIKGSCEYIKRITSSLIGNALKYEKTGGSVSIRLYKSGKTAHLSVTNKPTVISAQDLPHIFERFYRSDESRHNTESHGLGLAIAKNLTELMGGKITAESSEKDGTVFAVSFPLL